jgi:branched-chain amino acid transport system permease protein
VTDRFADVQADEANSTQGRAVIKWLLVAAVVALYLITVPVVFADRPYVLRVLATASVLSLISLGVWLTFSIGRINLARAASP